MTLPVVSTGVPAPKRGGNGQGRPARYPFASIKIGQHFDVKPEKGETLDQLVSRVRGAAATFRSRSQKKIGFAVRVEGKVVRCWATEYTPRFF